MGLFLSKVTENDHGGFGNAFALAAWKRTGRFDRSRRKLQPRDFSGHQMVRMAAGMITKILPAFAFWLAATPVAHSHPHIFIDAHADIEMDQNGQIAAIRHTWTFDPLFSSWLTQGIERDENHRLNQHRLDEIALHDVTELQHFDYYTQVTGDGVNLAFSATDAIAIEEVDKRLRLAFNIVPQRTGTPYQEIAISIFDPHYYTAFAFSNADGFTISGAPDQCSVTRHEAEPLPDSVLDRLADLAANVYELPPELAAAIGGREGKIVISCDEKDRSDSGSFP